MRNLPPLNCLTGFYAAAKHQSFTKAAQELNLTHGAVSRAVKQLEDFFGFQLFERRNRRVYLNERGQFFYEKATLALSDIQKACEELKQQSAFNTISISCEPSLAMRWFMPRLNNARDFLPDVDIQLSTAGGPIDLAGHNIDIAIRRSDFSWPEEYWVTPLGNEWIGPVCNPEYLKNLTEGGPTALHTRTRPHAWTDWQNLSADHFEFTTEKYFDHFYFSLQAATAGLGMAIGPAQLVHDDLNQNTLSAPIGFVETEFQYVALTLKNPKSDIPLQKLLAWIIKEFEASQP